jgi:hypothetical protein
LLLGYYHLVDDLFLTEDFREDLVVDVIGLDGEGVANFLAFVVFANGLPDELTLHGDALVVLTPRQPWKNRDDAPDLRAINKEVVEWVNGFGWIPARHSIDGYAVVLPRLLSVKL